MHEVNVAFDKLKESIPHHKLNQIDEKKDTKVRASVRANQSSSGDIICGHGSNKMGNISLLHSAPTT